MRGKIKSSLNAKVFLLVFCALAICSTMIYSIVMTVVPEHYQASFDSRLADNAKLLFTELETMTYEEGVKRIYDFCISNHATASLSGSRAALTFGMQEDNGGHSREETDRDEENDTSAVSLSAGFCFSDDDDPYILVITSVSDTVSDIKGMFRSLLPAIGAVILCISSLSALICSKIIAAPIVKISRISQRMAALDLDWQCETDSSDEIGVLALGLNTMAKRLQAVMERLEEANARLSEDVRRFQRLEEQRRHFFTAVSHELKTPLTILKGQLENMILGYGDYRNHEKYLPQAMKAAEDMEDLVMEILSIAKMETMKQAEAQEEISLSGLLRETAEAVLPLAEEKRIRLYQEIPEDMLIRVNPNLFRKALSNIIGNAVRHSPCGERVFVTLQRGSGLLVIENTGVSIAQEDLPHMFTPFYRTDKSRNKATGGSGLGLYLVKTILELHRMEYKIANTERGVGFYLKLPGTAADRL